MGAENRGENEERTAEVVVGSCRGRRKADPRDARMAGLTQQLTNACSLLAVTYDYRFRFTSSVSISSAVVITRALAWKPRCAIIMLVNSSDRSTFELSSAPGVMVD